MLCGDMSKNRISKSNTGLDKKIVLSKNLTHNNLIINILYMPFPKKYLPFSIKNGPLAGKMNFIVFMIYSAISPSPISPILYYQLIE
jgi:hypothetical protein